MSRKRLFGNLPYTVNQQALQDIFSQYETLESAKLIMDNATGQSKGFGFVEISSGSEVEKAIQRINGTTIDNCEIKVSETKPTKSRSRINKSYENDQRGFRSVYRKK